MLGFSYAIRLALSHFSMSQIYSELKVLKNKEKSLFSNEIREALFLQWMFIQGLVASPCLFAFLFLTLPQSSSELGGKSVLFAQVLSTLISACLQEFSTSTSLDEL